MAFKALDRQLPAQFRPSSSSAIASPLARVKWFPNDGPIGSIRFNWTRGLEVAMCRYLGIEPPPISPPKGSLGTYRVLAWYDAETHSVALEPRPIDSGEGYTAYARLFRMTHAIDEWHLRPRGLNDHWTEAKPVHLAEGRYGWAIALPPESQG